MSSQTIILLKSVPRYEMFEGISCKRRADYIASDITKATYDAGLTDGDVQTEIEGDYVLVKVVIGGNDEGLNQTFRADNERLQKALAET